MRALPRHPEFLGRPILVGDRVRIEAGFGRRWDDGWRTISDIKIRGLTFQGFAYDEPEIWMSAIGHTTTVIYPRDVLEHEPKPPYVTSWVGEPPPMDTPGAVVHDVSDGER